MKKEAYTDSNVEAVGKRLKQLAKHWCLEEPEVVKSLLLKKAAA
jgi:hypothetical protein